MSRRPLSIAHIALAVPLALAAVTGITPNPPATVHAGGHGGGIGSVHGADVSWPNCPKGEGIPSRRSKGEPMPKRSARFVVVGVTNGPGFHPNPCLARQLAWVARHHRMLGGYALTTYPGPQQFRRNRQAGPFDGSHLLGGLRNAGYAEAKYNVRTMRRVGMRVPMIWVDVEPYAVAPWSLRKTANRAVVSGAIRAYRDSGYRVGIYTYLNGWRAVAGGWRLTQLPTWSTVGHLHSAEALASCTRGPSGGPTWLAQWYSPHRDYDLVCPGAPSSAELFTAAAS